MAKKQQLSLDEKLEQALVKPDEQPYAVTENWVWTKIGVVCKVNPTKINTKDYEDSFEVTFIPMAAISEVVGNIQNYEVRAISSVKSGYTNFVEDDILFAKITPCMENGKSAIATGLRNNIGYGSTEFHVLRATKCVINKFVFYLLRCEEFRKKAKKRMSGSVGQQRVPREYMESYCIAIPPRAEQLRIVATIESLFAKLDRAKELVLASLDSFAERKAAILHQAFSGELTRKWREERGLKGLNGWEPKQIKDMCKLSSGGTPSRRCEEYYLGLIPWVKTGEINWNHIYDSEEKITQDAIENSSAKIFPIGSVLVAMYGQGLTRGRAAILDIEAATNQAVCALLPRAALNNRFLYYYFMANYWTFREKAVGGNQPNLSGKLIGEFEIGIPSLEEQQEIVRILDELLEQESKAAELADVLQQIDQMKQTILAKAFRGELGTNDPAEESALELLKSVLQEN